MLCNKIFISYSHCDTNKIGEYVSKLKEFGYEPYYDDDSFYAGEILNDTIHKHIEESFCTIFFLSKNSIKSKWCYDEMCYLHNEFETNFSNEKRDKRLRGCIVVQIGEWNFADYNKNCENIDYESRKIVSGFYKLFSDEQIRIIDDEKEHISKLKSAIDKIYVEKEKADSIIPKVFEKNEYKTDSLTANLDFYDTQDMSIDEGEKEDQQ